MSTSFVDADGTTRFRGTLVGGGSQPGAAVYVAMLFTETPGAGTYNATVDLPAGSSVLGFWANFTESWDADSVTFSVGDSDSAVAYADNISDDGAQGNGYFPTDLQNTRHPALTFTDFTNADYPAATTIGVEVVTTGAGGSTGRFVVHLFYADNVSTVNAVKS